MQLLFVFLLVCTASLSGCSHGTIETNATSIPLEGRVTQDESQLEFEVDSEAVSLMYKVGDEGQVSVRGELQASLEFLLRAPGGHWDLSPYAGIGIGFQNTGSRMVSLLAHLQGTRQEPYGKGLDGYLHLLPGETGRLVVPFSKTEADDHKNPLFASLAVTPDGRRHHWNLLPVDHVNAIVVTVDSPDRNFQLEDVRLFGLSRRNQDAVANLNSLPYLDQFGQRTGLEWPGKVQDQKQLRSRRESDELAPTVSENGLLVPPLVADTPPDASKVARHADIEKPYQVEKRDNKWELVGPDGSSFWSLGINSIGQGSPVRVWKRRELFQWLPAIENDPLGAAYTKRNRIGYIDFYRSNLIRKYGAEYQALSANVTAGRLQSWGINTIGINASKPVIEATTLPFSTLIDATTPELRFIENLPDPFDPAFRDSLWSSAKRAGASVAEDARCFGVFVDQDQYWPRDLVSQVFERPSPAKDAMIDDLDSHYQEIESLNRSWETSFSSWEQVRIPRDASVRAQDFSTVASDQSKIDVPLGNRVHPPELVADVERLYRLYANQYFALCKDAVREFLPQQLYLGSRIRDCPALGLECCGQFADVISVNHFRATAEFLPVPKHIDKPVLISRFHFGSMDGGVPGLGNVCVGDQRERARMFARFVLTALEDPRIIGVHWDAYVDQSAAALPGRGSQVGFVDVTDEPYPELVDMTKALSDKLSDFRRSNPGDSLKSLETLLQR